MAGQKDPDPPEKQAHLEEREEPPGRTPAFPIGRMVDLGARLVLALLFLGGRPLSRRFPPLSLRERGWGRGLSGLEHGPDDGRQGGEVRDRDHGAGGDRVASSTSPRPPSFQVYSLADLDRRSGPASIGRSSLTQLHGNGRAPHKWARSKQALSAVGFAFRSWVALGKARPPLRDAIHAPGQVLGIEVKAALRATDWKRVGTVGGIAAAVGVALLTLVLLVADLTDDMKPTHVGAAAAAAMIPAPPETTMMTPPPAPAAPIYEDPFVYDVTPAPIAVTKPKPRPQQRAVVAPAKPKIPKGKKPGDLLIPY